MKSGFSVFDARVRVGVCLKFIQRDHFIGLDLKDRHELAGNNTYGLYATNAIKIWNECIGREPLRSDAASGYLSGVTRDLDNDL